MNIKLENFIQRLKTILKNKRFYWSLFLVILFLSQIAFVALIQFYQLPAYTKAVSALNTQYQGLELQQQEMYDNTGVNQVLEDYAESVDRIKIFKNAREQVFVFSENENGKKYDFFPNLLETIFPVITKHLHNDVTIEGISLNEKGDLVIPLFSHSYTILAKQYASFKQAFDTEEVPILTNIKLNTFLRQEIEILEKDKSGRLIKTKKKVNKATIIASLNPEFFALKNSEVEESWEDFTYDYGLNKEQKKSFINKSIEVVKNISNNIYLDIQMFKEFVIRRIEGFQSTAAVAVIPETRNTSELFEEPVIDVLADELLEEEIITEEMISEEVTDPVVEIAEEPMIEEEQKILTSLMPGFSIQGVQWSRVPQKMSEFLTVGKTLYVEELEISPYQSYGKDELQDIAVKMMERIIEKTPGNVVVFHNVVPDVSAIIEDRVDLLKINSAY